MWTVMMAALLAGSPVSMQFDGSLKDALKQISEKGHLNVVVIGDLDEHVQLNLPNAASEDALETIAAAYSLEVTRSGKGNLWVIRRAPGAAPVVAPVATVPPVPPVPPVPAAVPSVPVVVVTPGSSAEELQREADEARQAADAARAEAEQISQKLDSLKNASQEARDQAREALEAARERARDAAEEAREKAQEAAEVAREEAEAAREAAREKADSEREAALDKAEALRDVAEAKAELKRQRAELQRHRVSTGGPITVEANTVVESAVAYGGPVIVEENAVVEGDAVAFGGDVVVKKGAHVEGDAVSFGGSVVREEGAKVDGESVSMGGAGFGASVARNVVKKEKSERHDAVAADDESNPGRGFAAFLLQFAVFFGLGFVLMMFAPQRMKALEATIRAEPAKNGLAGFLGLVAAIPLTAALVVTLIGIPVAMMMWVMVALFVPAGLAVVANAVGAKIPTGRFRKTQALVLALGLLALLLVGRVPVIGPLLLACAVFISMGAIIRTRFGQNGRGLPTVDASQTVTAPLI